MRLNNRFKRCELPSDSQPEIQKNRIVLLNILGGYWKWKHAVFELLQISQNSFSWNTFLVPHISWIIPQWSNIIGSHYLKDFLKYLVDLHMQNWYTWKCLGTECIHYYEEMTSHWSQQNSMHMEQLDTLLAMKTRILTISRYLISKKLLAAEMSHLTKSSFSNQLMYSNSHK